jgi:hypothetical protein
MDKADAVARVQDFLNKYAPKEMKSTIYLWGDDSTRVAEVSFSNDKAGCAYMQADLPWGLAVCAQTERCLVAVMDVWTDEGEVEEEFQRLGWLLASKDK